MGALPSRESLQQYEEELSSSTREMKCKSVENLFDISLGINNCRKSTERVHSRSKKKEIVIIPLTKLLINRLAYGRPCNISSKAAAKRDAINELDTMSEICNENEKTCNKLVVKVNVEPEKNNSESSLDNNEFVINKCEELLLFPTPQQNHQSEYNQHEKYLEFEEKDVCVSVEENINTTITKSRIIIENETSVSSFPLIRQLFTAYNEPAVQFYRVTSHSNSKMYKSDELSLRTRYSTLLEFYNDTVERYDKRLYSTDEELCLSWLSTWKENSQNEEIKDKNKVSEQTYNNRNHYSNANNNNNDNNNTVNNHSNKEYVNDETVINNYDDEQSYYHYINAITLHLENLCKVANKQDVTSKSNFEHERYKSKQELTQEEKTQFFSFSRSLDYIPEKLWPIPCAICFAYPIQQLHKVKKRHKQTSSKSSIVTSSKECTEIVKEPLSKQPDMHSLLSPFPELTLESYGNSTSGEVITIPANGSDTGKVQNNINANMWKNNEQQSRYSERPVSHCTRMKNTTVNNSSNNGNNLSKLQSDEINHNQAKLGQKAKTKKCNTNDNVFELESDIHFERVMFGSHYALMAIGYIGLVPIESETNNIILSEDQEENLFSVSCNMQNSNVASTVAAKATNTFFDDHNDNSSKMENCHHRHHSSDKLVNNQCISVNLNSENGNISYNKQRSMSNA